MIYHTKCINTQNLFVDSSMIQTIQGRDMIGINHYDRGRNCNKISIVVTSNGFPIGMKISTSNVHDLNLIEPTLDDISIKIINSKLVGEVSASIKKKLDIMRKINLIYPKKKGQKIIEKRYIVEKGWGKLHHHGAVKK